MRSEREILAATRRLAHDAQVEMPAGDAEALRLLAQTTTEQHVAASALDLEAELRLHLHTRRVRRRAELADSLERLRRARNTAELIEDTCEQAARGCGLQRVLLSRVREGVWSPWKLYDGHDGGVPIAAVAFDAALVQQALRRLMQWEHFIVAAIAPAGEPLGLLHADPIDDHSLQLLHEFANCFGRIYERTALRDHLDAQRTRIRAAAAEADAITAESHREIDLVRLVGSERPAETSTPTFDALAGPSVPDDSLTPRERDVLALMRRGWSNAQIADQLAVQPSTVKSHVRAILRKLGAVNRVEAIATAARPIAGGRQRAQSAP